MEDLNGIVRMFYVIIYIYIISNIRRTKSSNLIVPRLVLQLSLPNTMKPGVRSRIEMWLEHRLSALLQLHLSDRQFYCLLRCVLY